MTVSNSGCFGEVSCMVKVAGYPCEMSTAYVGLVVNYTSRAVNGVIQKNTVSLCFSGQRCVSLHVQ